MVSLWWSLILFGGVFITSEWFMNVENDAKYYFMSMAAVVWLMAACWSGCGLQRLRRALYNPSCLVGAASVCLLLSAYGLMQYGGMLPSRHAAFPMTGTFENPAGFAAAQAVLFPFAFTLCLARDVAPGVRLFGWCASVACGVTVVLSGSRAGMLAVCAAAVVVCACQPRLMVTGRMLRRMWLPIAVAVAGVAVLLYRAKTGSVDGRLFIWGRCLELIAERPLFGHGACGFQRCYMDAQAAFFSVHPDAPAVMLADNITHPFNEYLLLAVKWGLAGLLAAWSLLVFIVVRLFRTDGPEKTVGLAAMASVFVMCQFSYPFHYAVVWFIAVLAAVPAFFKYRPHADSRPVPPVIRVPVALLLLIVLAFLLRSAYLDMKWAEMSKRCLSGYTERMLPYYARMKHIRQRHPLFLYNYAAELNYAGRYSESVAVARECMRWMNDYDVQMLLADSYAETGKTESAIAAYRKASLMIPCRFEPLDGLLEVYVGRGDTLRATALARTMLAKPVKVPSSRVRQIQHHAVAVLEEFSAKDTGAGL